ncbi:sulfotransferase [Phaeobacter sp. JL2872]|jgi:hypothetical protein|uniref:sulfotransferase domain-containing protein n=1 Tax=Phaeobacter sp. JL2872 TaxID=2461377 RepID=UPI000D5F9410|nr:sulfotransferase domain-containing protein [Phaeobacter sp. JL2872]MEE2635199.1 sulfotransferase domain-containing protein [Pseudomonadota bacterium]PVZ45298.1 sulfotransferase [Phaeobacter sp. JL2872]
MSTARKPQRVDFVVAGAQKSGTTALRRFLGKSSAIGLVQHGGETHFFDRWSEAAARGDYSAYHKMYSQKALAICTGDVTPIYLYRHDCLANVKKYNPDMKIIVLLRNPAERAYSQWVMEVEKGNETRSFLGAILHEARHYRKHGQHPVYSYIQRGFYDDQIARVQALFPPENVLILRTEDLRREHDSTIEAIFRFLGVPPDFVPAQEVVHSREYSKMPRITRHLLLLIFRQDIRRLEKRLGWDLSDWLRG